MFQQSRGYITVQISPEAFTIVSLCVLSIQPLKSSFQNFLSSIYLICHVYKGLHPSFALTMAPIEMIQASPSVSPAQQRTPLSSPSLPSPAFQNSASTAQLGLIQTILSNSQIAFIASIAFVALWSVNRLRIKIKDRSMLMTS